MTQNKLHFSYSIYNNYMRFRIVGISIALLVAVSATYAQPAAHGRHIYKTGRNEAGQRLLDKQHSGLTIFKSCQACHGPNGNRIKDCNITWRYLADPTKVTTPYTPELFYRFIDEDMKSDGTAARTGVHWHMTTQEKDDLMAYLKTL